MMAWRDHLRTITQHNIRTLCHAPLSELSGALGDLGTLLPLMIAMTLNDTIDLPTTLVFSGLANILTGIVYGIPLPVQPMKAIASVAISQAFTKSETMAAGLTMGIAVFVLSATGLLGWLNRVVPVPVVKGIQVGAGFALVINAGSSLILPLDWASSGWDNRIWAIGAFLALAIASLMPRLPYALVVFSVGILIAGIVVASSPHHGDFHAGIWSPSVHVPEGHAWWTGAIDAALPQLPLTTLNSILAVTSLSANLFPNYPPTPSTTSIGFSVAIANLVGCWFGAMPVCHGSGGLAGQYRFGARSGSSVVILGTVKLLLGLFVGEAIVPLLQRFPKSLLGVMVLAAGVELAKVGQSVSEKRDLWQNAGDNYGNERSIDDLKKDQEQEEKNRWLVMLVTVAGCLAFKNDAIGFIAGLVWHWSLQLPRLTERVRGGRSIRLQDEQEPESGNNLLERNR
ncbi:hypothetical protein D0869_01575 [Hortaea werneckii]|uniref:SLC26A/SulP transporter domain-containing protein n=1 Tax=Hortaea werneckii TaxID=91943 RepID=A0A3M6XCD1_HORWE|nr:hypothetical protein KC324_g7271 [Hortaea werneckii]KAI7527517.1 hypothetical protein KC316_g17963 [Hortaea werneckii]RMX88492.1 hypothetical protein D0869_01575 [Hortaea werneckii]RMY14683.1 hypothetical protein D0868_01304 [Hortaea werneckii]